jgi:lipid-A-disaccharide synthase
MYRIGIVAGEASGDILGADLIRALRATAPDIRVEGIGGPCMIQAGCEVIVPLEKLSVMGLMEVIGRYRELLGIRKSIAAHFFNNPPDLFIGIDAPDFNLVLESRLHRSGIKTVHYVSPQVWAWREYRVRKIRKAVDRMLVLLPFEKEYYDGRGIPVTYVGHPAADRIKLVPERAAARARLGLPGDKKIIALMPGSRTMELDRLLSPFLHAAQWCVKQRDDIYFASSLLNQAAVDQFNQALSTSTLKDLPVSVYNNRADDVLEAADTALLASGTITLEAMLYKLPMVVAYKMNALSFRLINTLVKVKYAALPNLLAGAEVVPEFLQGKCRPDKLGAALLEWLDDVSGVEKLQETFTSMHKQLQRNASITAAQSILDLLGRP